MPDVYMKGLSDIRVENPPVRKIGVYRRADRTASPAALKFEEYLRGEVHDAQRRLEALTKSRETPPPAQRDKNPAVTAETR